MPAKFVVKKGPTGKFRWSLLGTNGKVIVSSEPYGTKRAALTSLEAVRKNAGAAKLDDQTDGTKPAGRPAPAKRSPAKKPAASARKTAGRSRTAGRTTTRRRAA